MIGNFLNEEIVKERKLPSLNQAASNRIVRIAQALVKSGGKVVVLSGASTMRLRFDRCLIHPSKEFSIGGVTIVFSAIVAVPFLSFLCEPLFLLVKTIKTGLRKRPDLVIMYNYYPATILAGFMAKVFFRSRVILDIEDVCTPRLIDWIGRGDGRPAQQLLGRFLMQLGIAFSDRVMVPSQRFTQSAGLKHPPIVVTGCIDIAEKRSLRSKKSDEPIMILISGKLDAEQGVDLVLDAICAFTTKGIPPRALHFHLCGFSDNPSLLTKRITDATEQGAVIVFHGCVSAPEYEHLLWRTDACVAMQNPHGRHGREKTPSKVYEYLAHGKIVIATDVGDFGQLPNDVIHLCDYDEIRLSECFSDLSINWEDWSCMGHRAAEHAEAEFGFASVGKKIQASVMMEELS